MKPLTDLHLHLDGALRPSTMLEIAKTEGVELPAKDEASLRAALMCGQVRTSVDECLSFFDLTVSVMQSEEAIARATRELLEDCAAIGLKYVEIRFSPLLHTKCGLRMDQALRAVLNETGRSEATYGIRANVILCSLWHFTPRETLQIVALASSYQNPAGGICGIDMAGGELTSAPGHVEHHARHFRSAAGLGLGVTVHAGESAPGWNVARVLDLFEPDRIGHATRAIEDPSLVYALYERGVAIECCPSSNLQTGIVKDYASHPGQIYLRRKIPVCLNSDDPLMMDTDVAREFERVRRPWNLTEKEEAFLHDTGIARSFASPAWKAWLREELRLRRHAPAP